MSTEGKTIDELHAERDEAMEKLYKNTDENLAALRGDDFTPEPEPKPNPEPEPDPEPESDPQPGPEPKSDPEPDPEPEPEPKPEPEPAGDDPEPADEHALTQAETRAAIHSGWSQEDIDELAEANPGLAKKTCAKALESQNNLSQKFSELGKTQVTKEEPAVPVTPAPVPQPKSIDFTALETEYENDPIVGMTKQLYAQNQALATKVDALEAAGPKAEAKVNEAQAQHDAAVSQQIDTFFDRPDVAAYGDTYGAVEKGSRDWDSLTQGQIKKRYEVAEEANRIMLGAQKMKQDMPLDEAFERAHFLVTKDEQEVVIRKSIKAKAVKRAKSLTLAPTDSVKVSDTGKKTLAKAEANAERTLAKLRKG